MTGNIKDINKQIAAFMLVSIALSLPTATSDAAAPLDIDYGNIGGISSGKIDIPPTLMYAAPEIPSIQAPNIPQVEMYATPEIPGIQNPNIPQVEMYAPPEIPSIKPTRIDQAVAMYAVPDVLREKRIQYQQPDNSTGIQGVSEKKLKSDESVNIIEASPKLINSMGEKAKVNTSNSANSSEISIEKASKTENFVNSKYGTVKVLDRGHFIFK